MGEFLMGELFEKGPVRRKDEGMREAKNGEVIQTGE